MLNNQANQNRNDLGPYTSMILDVSDQYGVEAGLIAAVIKVESDNRPSAMSSRGAIGLMQVLPGTARDMGLENTELLYDPLTNIEVGTAYLAQQIERFRDIDKALAAYNAGPSRIASGSPWPSETVNYVNKVKRTWVPATRETGVSYRLSDSYILLGLAIGIGLRYVLNRFKL